MASNQRLLKAYLRYDDTGRISPGSLVLRGNMPKGRGWVEVPAYECCNAFMTLTNTLTAGITPGTVCVTGFSILCDDVSVLDVTYAFSTSILTVVSQLNSQYGFLGTWKAPNSGTLSLEIKEEVAKDLCPTGTLTIEFICAT